MLQSRSRRRGAIDFEHAVPVFICIILLIILFPVFERARKNGRRSECMTNLKQITLAVLQYANDNEGYYPVAVRGQSSLKTGGEKYIGWADTIQPYVKSIEIYQCPEEVSGASPDPANTSYVDYWYNPALSWNGKRGSAARWNEKRAFKRASQVSMTVMLGDAGKVNGMGTATSRCNGYECSGNNDVSSPSTNAPSGRVANKGFADGGLRHLDGLNIAFADGHVKWFRSTGPNRSDRIYNLFTSIKWSGSNPTFNVKQN